jgi:hypothetical protein
MPDAEIRRRILAAYDGATYKPSIATLADNEWHCDHVRAGRIHRRLIETGEVPTLPGRDTSPQARERRKATLRSRAHKVSNVTGRAPARPEPAAEPAEHQRLVAEHRGRERRIGL